MIQTCDNPAIEAAAKALWEHVTTDMGDTSPWAEAGDEEAADCRGLVRLVLTTAGYDDALREVDVTNAAARILTDERNQANQRVAELEEQLQRLRAVPENGSRGRT